MRQLASLGSWLRSRRRRQPLICVVILLTVVYFLNRQHGSTSHKGTWRGIVITTPSNSTYPLHYLPLDYGPKFHRTARYPTLGAVSPIRPEHGANDGTAKFPTHIFRHGSDEYIATNEVKEPGHIWRIELDLGEEEGSVGEYELLQFIWSAGSQPAYALKTRDGKYVVSVNYESDVVAVHKFAKSKELEAVQKIRLPRPRGVPMSAPSHPHQVTQHPTKDLFYVPDLGHNTIHVLALRSGLSSPLQIVQSWLVDTGGRGPRHGVVTPDGKTLMMSFQQSSTVIPFPLTPEGLIARHPAASSQSSLTLAARLHHRTKEQIERTFASSDVLLHGRTLLVANRQVIGPYSPLGDGLSGDSPVGGDTLAVFHAVRTGKGDKQSTGLNLIGHIELGCWQPREMAILAGPERDFVAVTCNGAEGAGGGVVILDPLYVPSGDLEAEARKQRRDIPSWPIIDRWDGQLAMGLAGAWD